MVIDMQDVRSDLLAALRKLGNQQIRISVSGTQGALTLTGADIVQGSFAIDRTCVSGSKMEIGSCIASELTMTLKNTDGRFDDIAFEGAELFVELGAVIEGATVFMPMGYFTVDSPPRKLSTISIAALDRMAQLDKPYNSTIIFPATVRDIYFDVLSNCNLTSGTAGYVLNALPNISYTVRQKPSDDDLTYRQVLSWVAELTGTNAYINCNGAVCLASMPTDDACTTIMASDRYSSDIQEQAITITGVQLCADDKTAYLSGEDGYVLEIKDNGLAQGDYDALVSALGQRLIGYTYTPFTASVVPMPHLWPMDKVGFVDKNGVTHDAVLTNVCFKLRGNTEIESKGETAVNAGYAAINPLTKAEKAIIAAMERETNKRLDAGVQSTLYLNQMIGGAMGLYGTDVAQDDGSVKHYWHDAPTLDDSTTIYTYTANGYAWTNDGWQDGSPVWQYGIDKSGNAVYNSLYAYKITADMIDVQDLNALNATIGGWSISDGCISYVNDDNYWMQLSTTGDTIGAGEYFLAAGRAMNTITSISKDGHFKTASGEFSGTVIAQAGKIGDWTIEKLTLNKTSTGTIAVNSLRADDTHYLAPTAELTGHDYSPAIMWGEHFHLYSDGHIKCTSADIKGKITAQEGNIGGWEIGEHKLYKNGAYTVKRGTGLSDYVYDNTFCLSPTGDDEPNVIYFKSVQQGVTDATEYLFVVSKDGKMTCNNADVIGKITATEGKIGNWIIGTLTLNTTSTSTIDVNSLYVDATHYLAPTAELAGHNYSPAIRWGEHFGLYSDGHIKCTSADITGSVTATSFTAQTSGGVQRATMDEDGMRVGYMSGNTAQYSSLYSAGGITWSGSLPNSGFLIGSTTGGMLVTGGPMSSGTLIGTWYTKGSIINGSDITIKHDIADLSDAYTALFDALRPVVYKYNDGTSDRYHTGFIAQEVEAATLAAGLTTQDFAAFCRGEDGVCGLRYEEFIAINVSEIQKLKARVAELERVVANAG